MSEDKYFKNLLTYDAASPFNLKNLYFSPYLKDLKDNQKLLTWFEQETSQLVAEDNVSTKLLAFIKRCVVVIYGGYRERWVCSLFVCLMCVKGVIVCKINYEYCGVSVCAV